MKASADVDRVAVERAIATFFADRQSGNWPVSISEGLASVRRWHPNVSLSDQEISAMVANYAVHRGLNLHFDRPMAPIVEARADIAWKITPH